MYEYSNFYSCSNVYEQLLLASTHQSSAVSMHVNIHKDATCNILLLTPFGSGDLGFRFMDVVDGNFIHQALFRVKRGV